MRPIKTEFEWTLEVGGNEVDVVADINYYKGTPATYDQPEDFGDAEIVSIRDVSGKKLNISSEQEEEVLDAFFDNFSAEDYFEEPEYDYESYRE